MQKKTEKEIKKYARYLITVSNNYCQFLNVEEGIEKERLKMVPCTVNASQFQFNMTSRVLFRNKLAITEDSTVGVYLGKFGSIYYDKEAFLLFKAAEQYFSSFFLVLLSPTDKEELFEKLKAVNFPLHKVYVTSAAHTEIPSYLSAADFAFSTIKPAACRRFCSPVKDGEYWANGLAILLPDGVGDDSEIIKAEGGGAIIDVNDPVNLTKAFEFIEKVLNKGLSARTEIADLAIKYRNPAIAEKVYKEILEELILSK